jgi:hypothetical protein
MQRWMSTMPRTWWGFHPSVMLPCLGLYQVLGLVWVADLRWRRTEESDKYVSFWKIYVRSFQSSALSTYSEQCLVAIFQDLLAGPKLRKERLRSKSTLRLMSESSSHIPAKTCLCSRPLTNRLRSNWANWALLFVIGPMSVRMRRTDLPHGIWSTERTE